MCPRTCALGLSSSLLSENKKKTTKVCEIGDRESYFGALFILWIHGKNSHIRTTCKLGGHDLYTQFYILYSQPRKIQFLPTSCWLNFSAPIFFVWLLHIFARTQTKETPSDLCTFDLAIGLFVFLGYFFFLFLLISPHCGYFFLLLSLGSWVFMVNFPSKWMLFCLHSNS